MKISIRNNKYGCSETVKPIPYIYDNAYNFSNKKIVKKENIVYYIFDNMWINSTTHERCYNLDNCDNYTLIFKLYFAILITKTTADIFDKYGNILTRCDVDYDNLDFYDILNKCIPKLIRKEKIKSFLV